MAGKTHIVDAVTSEVDGVSKKQAADTVDAVFNAITRSLQDGERVSVPGFGSFSVSQRAARTGRNPATGESIQIPAAKAPRFKPSKDLKTSLNG